MEQIHPQARTKLAVRGDITRSPEPASVVAKRYGISDETVRKWWRRGEQAVQDRSSRPKRLAWLTNEEERANICAVRRVTGFLLDDLVFVVRHFLPHLNRDSIDRVLKAKGLNRRPPKPTVQPRKGRDASTTLISVLSTSTLNICLSCGPRTARSVSASSVSQSIAAHVCPPRRLRRRERRRCGCLPKSRQEDLPLPHHLCADGSGFPLHRRRF